MIVPENPDRIAELKKRIEANLKAGDWGPTTIETSTSFVLLDDDVAPVEKLDD